MDTINSFWVWECQQILVKLSALNQIYQCVGFLVIEDLRRTERLTTTKGESRTSLIDPESVCKICKTLARRTPFKGSPIVITGVAFSWSTPDGPTPHLSFQVSLYQRLFTSYFNTIKVFMDSEALFSYTLSS